MDRAITSTSSQSTLKRCPRCEETLAQSEFGVCRARKDGLNLYCKRCIRQKIAQSRQALREYKNARIKAGVPIELTAPKVVTGFSPRRLAYLLRRLTPADRVREAIRCGAREQKEIARVTRLPPDEVCDALAKLLLWTREIRTQIINHKRMYFVANAPAADIPSRKPSEFRISQQTFSAVQASMPGRRKRGSAG